MPTRRILTEAQIEFIRNNRLLFSSRQLAAKIGCSKFFIQRFMKKNGWTPPTSVIEEFRIKAMIGRTTSTPEIDLFLKKNYLDLPVNRMAIAVKRSETLVKGRMRQLELVQPRELIEKFKLESRIQPGSVSFNKGKKQTDYMSKAAIRRTMATRFKKGQLPKNTRSDFEITIRKDRRNVKYQYIRVKLGVWTPLHRFIWEMINYPISGKMNLVFKDHDTLNCELKNLELLTDAQLMKRNSYHNYPEPIARTIQLSGALTRQINKHVKKLRNEK